MYDTILTIWNQKLSRSRACNRQTVFFNLTIRNNGHVLNGKCRLILIWNKLKINAREYQRGNKKWTIQRNWQHRVHMKKKNKTKTQYITELQISCVFAFFTLWKRVKTHVLSDQSVHITHTYCCVSKLSKFGAYLYSRVHNNTFLSLRNSP